MNPDLVTWSDVDRVQETIADLKKEILKAEHKIQNAAKTFSWDEVPKSPIKTEWKASSSGPRSYHQRHFSANQVPHLTVEGNNNEEERPKYSGPRPYHKNHEEQIKRKVIQVALSKALWRISSDNSSITSNSHDVVNTLPNFKEKGTNTVPKSAASSSKVLFSEWEQEFLKKEVPELNIERSYFSAKKKTLPRKTLKYQIEPLSQSPSEIKKKMKSLVAKQQSEIAASELDDDIFPLDNEATKPKEALQIIHQPPNVPIYEHLQWTTEVECPEKPLSPVRKISVILPPTQYKGFSPIVRHQRKPLKGRSLSAGNASTPVKEVTSPEKIRKTCVVKDKQYITPFSWRDAQKFALQKLGPPPQLSKAKTEGKLPEDSSVGQGNDNSKGDSCSYPLPQNDIATPAANDDLQSGTIDLTDSPEKKKEEKEVEDHSANPNDLSDIHLAAAKKILSDLPVLGSSSDTEQEGSPEIAKALCDRTKTVKRKAMKPLETASPMPKIRHYDRNAVRDYIAKQKAQRRRKQHEDRLKKLQSDKIKQDRLFQLYAQQQQAAKTTIKLKQPTTPKSSLGIFKVAKRVEIIPDELGSQIKSLNKDEVVKHDAEVLRPNENKVSAVPFVTGKKISENRCLTESDLTPLNDKTGSNDLVDVEQPALPFEIDKPIAVKTPTSASKVSVRTQTSYIIPNEKENKEPISNSSKSVERIVAQKSPRKKQRQPLSGDKPLHGDSLNIVTRQNFVSGTSFGTSSIISSSNAESTIDSLSSTESLDIFPVKMVPSKIDLKLNDLALSIKKQAGIGIQFLGEYIKLQQQSAEKLLNPSASQISDDEELIERSLDDKSELNYTGAENKNENQLVVKNLQQDKQSVADVKNIIPKEPPKIELNHPDFQEIIIPKETSKIELNLPDFQSKIKTPTQTTLDDENVFGFSKFKPKPDPYNFINTWNKKPLSVFFPSKSISDEQESQPPSYAPDDSKHALSSSANDTYTSDFATEKESDVPDNVSQKSETQSTISNDSELHSNDQDRTIISALIADSRYANNNSLEPADSRIFKACEATSESQMKGKLQLDVNESTSSQNNINSVSQSKAEERKLMIGSNVEHVGNSKEKHKPENSESEAREELSEKFDSNLDIVEEPLTSINDEGSERTSKSLQESSPVIETNSHESSTIDSVENLEMVQSEENKEKTLVAKDSSVSSLSTNEKISHGSTKVPEVVRPVVQSFLFDPNTITRVATEVATAAATSAVIAVLETQKSLSLKKPAVHIPETDTSPKHDYSTDFENSPGSSPLPHSRQSCSDQANMNISSPEEIVEEQCTAASSSEKSEKSAYAKSSIGLSFHESKLGSFDSIVSDVRDGRFDLKVQASTSKESDGASEIFVRKKKILKDTVSSPSPASLSDERSTPSTMLSSTGSAVTSSHGKASKIVPGSRLTFDIMRRMAFEEELRAHHQLYVLEVQEQSLIKKVRAELKLLEKLKRQMKSDNDLKQVAVIEKKQHKLVSSLRQERAQIRCMQETYRSVGRKQQNISFMKKKQNTEHNQDFKTKKHITAASFENVTEKVHLSASASILSIATEEENTVEEVKSPSEIPEILMASSSSLESVGESQIAAGSKSSHTSLNVGQDNALHTGLSKSAKQESVVSQLSLHSSHSLDSGLQGMKRLEANKRYLTKREQRLVQRRSHAESLLQWQKKLDSEEQEVRELEKRAIEIVEKSKLKTKYYASSSPTSPKNDALEAVSTEQPIAFPSSSSEVQDDSNTATYTKPAVESKDSNSIPEEDLHASFSSKTEEEIIEELKIFDVSRKFSDSISSMNGDGDAKLASISEHLAVSSNCSTIIEEVGSAKLNGSQQSTKKSASSVDAYSESFESTNGTSNTPESPVQLKKITYADGSKKQIGTRRSSLASLYYRRHDSSGSDDSFTISHSETASDQSDIEGRISALTEQLRRRKDEAEKLRKEQKRQHWEHRKEKELSLKNQLDAYDKYIKETTLELDQQLEAAASNKVTSIVSVKPQIKQPRVAKFRHSPKSPSSSDSEPATNKKIKDSIDKEISEIKDVSFLSQERKAQSSSHLAKKLRAIETKEVSEEATAIDTGHSSHDTLSQKIRNSEKTTSSSVSMIHEDLPISSTSSQQNSEPSATASDSNQSCSQEFSSSDASPHSSRNNIVNVPIDEATSYAPIDINQSKPSEESSIEEMIEGPLDESEESNLSNRTFHEKTDRSTDGGSFESYSTVEEEEEIRETVESKGSCSASGGCFTPPREKSITTFEGSENRTEFLDKLLAFQSNEVHAKSVELALHATSTAQMKLESFVDKIVEEVIKSIIEGTECAIFFAATGREGNASDFVTQIGRLQTPIAPKSKLQRTLTSIHKKAALAVSEKVIESLLQDSIETIIAVKNNHNSIQKTFCDAKDNYVITKLPQVDREKSIIKKIFDDSNKKMDSTPSVSFGDAANEEVKIKKVVSNDKDKNPEIQSITTTQDQTSADPNLEARGNNEVQLLDQQLFIQQYPHYYRQIPNKPPPPYTPPSSPLVFNKQFRKETDQHKRSVNAIQDVLDKLDTIVEDNVEVILKGKEQGLSLEEITIPDEFLELSNLDQMTKNQKIFKSFLFELTRETAMKLYVEKEEKPQPWLRNQKLTPKPVLPKDKNKILQPLLKAIRQIMEPPPPLPPRDQSTWSAMKLGRKKRDFVDTIIINELREEEPEWVNYDQDEFLVKMQLTDSIFKVLVDDTIEVARSLNINPDLFKKSET